MSQKWNVVEEPEIVPAPLDEIIYKQIVAEIAEVLYSYFASSKRKDIQSVLSSVAPDLLSQLDLKRRSGLHG